MDQTSIEKAFERIKGLAAGRSLLEVEHATSYGTPALKVHGSTFARMLDPATLVLQCPEEQKSLLMEISPDIYFETDHYVGYPVVLIRLDAIGDEELSLRLEDAWRLKAPERLRALRPTAGA